MTWDKFVDLLQKFQSTLMWVGGGFIFGLLWVVRKIVTHERQITLLQQGLSHMEGMRAAEAEHREMQRAEDRKDLHEVKTTVNQLHQMLTEHLINGRKP